MSQRVPCVGGVRAGASRIRTTNHSGPIGVARQRAATTSRSYSHASAILAPSSPSSPSSPFNTHSTSPVCSQLIQPLPRLEVNHVIRLGQRSLHVGTRGASNILARGERAEELRRALARDHVGRELRRAGSELVDPGQHACGRLVCGGGGGGGPDAWKGAGGAEGAEGGAG
jgi:hypothetical protein